jgi:two-component system CheB/CheR fusion protein
MQRLIEDVLLFSKLSNVDLPFERVNVSEVIDHLIEDLEITIREKDANIKIGPLPVVYGIKGQVHQLFQNLLSNALKFAGERDSVILIGQTDLSPSLRNQLQISVADYFFISVKDNGIGFDSVYKEKIFGIFQRLNGNNYVGTGIGLAICKKIVENHKGVILTESKLGEGSEFIVGFPKMNVN